MDGKKASPLLTLLPVINDSLLIMAAFNLAFWVRFNSGWMPVDKGIPFFSYYLFSSFFPMGVWMFLFYLHGLYSIGKNFPFPEELYRIMKAGVMGTVIILTPTFFLRPFSYSRFVFLLACFLAFVFICIGRFALRRLRLNYYGRGYYLKRIAIVGEGNFVAVKQALRDSSHLGYEVVGTISDRTPGGSDWLGSGEAMK